MGNFDHVVLSCEHATNRVPASWQRQLQAVLSPSAQRAWQRALASHAGVDFGAWALGRQLAKLLDRPLVAAKHSRLLVDCNRSAHHPRRLSVFSRALAAPAQARLVAEAWTPHRAQVQQAVAQAIQRTGRAVHLALHSFTPSWAGVPRKVELGLLYDPGRVGEAAQAGAWQRALQTMPGAPRVRRNAPYRGVADGLPTALRRLWPATKYVGYELEVSQALTLAAPPVWTRTRKQLAYILAQCLHKNF